jgi:hypothetical protein
MSVDGPAQQDMGYPMVASPKRNLYRGDPQIVKFHLPMPHRFLPVWQTAPIVYDVPGIFILPSPGLFRRARR